MPWRDELQPASFRGVPFAVKEHEHLGGRRLVVHEFPMRDGPYVEDLGRKAHGFAMAAYVVGPEYMAERDALLAALNAAGIGKLVHPYFGERFVAVREYRQRESADEGGMCRFDIDFVEGQPIREPAVAENPEAAVEESALDAEDASRGEFMENYVVDGQPAFGLDSLEAMATESFEAINDAVAPVIEAVDAAADYARRYQGVLYTVAALVRSPAGFFDTTLALIGFNSSSLGQLLRLARYVSRVVQAPDTTPVRQRERANQAAMQSAVRRLAVIQCARVATTTRFASHEEAVAARDEVADLIDAEAETAGDDVFQKLQALRAALVNAVPGPDNRLSRILTYTPPVTLPALVIAYSLYGDIEDEPDIIARNAIRHPGFVPGGRELRVLSRVG